MNAKTPCHGTCHGLVDCRAGRTGQRSERAIGKVSSEPEIDGSGVTVVGNKAAVFDLNTREGIIVSGGMHVG